MKPCRAVLVFLVLTLCFLLHTSEALGVNGAVRFIRNGDPDDRQAWSSGIVQYRDNGEWGNVCDRPAFGQNEADVLCHQFSYTGASSYSNAANTVIYGTDSSGPTMEDVSCNTSNYLTISQCSFFRSNQFSSCTDSNDVVLTCYTTRIWSSPSIGDIRLTGGMYSNEGLLEIYCNGAWGTVCDDDFYSTQADVACRQLGYNSYSDYDIISGLRGNSSQNIWLEMVSSCSSSDSCLTECGRCPNTAVTICTHDEDITLICDYHAGFPKVTTTMIDDCDNDASEGAVRFYRNGVADTTQAWSTGIVEIFLNGRWGNICDDESFGFAEADVLCHQFGYTGSSGYDNPSYDTTYGTDPARTAMEGVNCEANYDRLTVTQCPYSTVPSGSCSDMDDIIITCYSDRIWDVPGVGSVRLTGGHYPNEGLLEVYCNDDWGTVCSSSFGITEARVTCRQLGYNYYTDYNHLQLEGRSFQNTWLKSFSGCSGATGVCLTECGGCPPKGVSCGASDVTLECSFDSTYSLAAADRFDSCYYIAAGTAELSPFATLGIAIGAGLFCCILCTVVPIVLVGVFAKVRMRSSKKNAPRVPQTMSELKDAMNANNKNPKAMEKTTKFKEPEPPSYPPAPLGNAGYSAPLQNYLQPVSQPGYPLQGEYPTQMINPPPQDYPPQAYPQPQSGGYPLQPQSFQPQEYPPQQTQGYVSPQSYPPPPPQENPSAVGNGQPAPTVAAPYPTITVQHQVTHQPLPYPSFDQQQDNSTAQSVQPPYPQ